MSAPNVLSHWRSGVAGATALAMTIGPAFGDESNPVTATQPLDVAHQEYVITGETPLVTAAQDLKPFTLSGGVGVIINHQDHNGGKSPEYIMEAYRGVFDEEQTVSDYRVTEREEPGTTIYFVVKGNSQGPYDINTAYTMIGDIADQNRFAHGIQTSSADNIDGIKDPEPEG